MRYDVSLFADQDLYLFNEGSHYRLYEKLGSHFMTVDGEEGTYFAVWAPNAENVYVTGSFNGWNKSSHPLRTKGVSGIWEGFIPGVTRGTAYKYHVVSRWNGYRFDKADPFAFHGEAPPDTGSVVWDLWFEWGDGEWMKDRVLRNGADSPISIYEAHLGSWIDRKSTRLNSSHQIISYAVFCLKKKKKKYARQGGREGEAGRGEGGA